MTTLLASTTATGPTATEGDVKALLTNLRDYIAGTLGADTANKGAIHGLLNTILYGQSVKTGAYTVVAADRGVVLNCSGTWTMNITAAATLGDGFTFAVRNSGSGAITIDPTLSETINAMSTIVIGSGDFVIVYCDGTGFSTVGGAAAPAGSMIPYAASAAPAGWLLCYGQTVSRSSYAALFLAIGTTYGAGDGSTTFGLPDLRGRVIAGKDNMGGTAASRLTSPVAGSTLGATGGAQSHTLTTAEMPAHTHGASTTDYTGTLTSTISTGPNAGSSMVTGSTGGDGAHNNVQPTFIANYIIKT